MNIATVLLAAGGSTRMGSPKQLLLYRGQTLVRRSTMTALASPCKPVHVVIGAEADPVRSNLEDLPVEIVENENWAQGVGSSLRVGLETALAGTPNLDAVLFMMCDQPHVTPDAIERLVSAYQQSGVPIVAAGYQNIVGVPALFSRSIFKDLLAVPPGEDPKCVIAAHAEQVFSISVPEAAIDIDTPKDYEALRWMSDQPQSV